MSTRSAGGNGSGDRSEGSAGAPHRIEVDAVNTKAKRSSYAARVKVHPKRVNGRFRNIKWAVMIATVAITASGARKTIGR